MWTATIVGFCVAGAACRQEPPAPPVRPGIARPLFGARQEIEPEPIKSRAEAPAPPAAMRDPFAFGAPEAPRARHGALPPLPPAAGLPELPLPLPQADVSLIGVAEGHESPPVRTAILSMAGEAVLARVGDVVAGRYTVMAIDAEAVDLLDHVHAVGQPGKRIVLCFMPCLRLAIRQFFRGAPKTPQHSV